MTDQLRCDYLSCNGHPSLKTPNIDKLAKSGVNFKNAFVQSPMCGPSRACFYTGRTIFSNGVTWNRVPLPIGELTIDDYLKPKGIRTAVVGKTHMEADVEGMHRLGLNKGTEIGMIISEPGFEPYEKDDGLHPTPGYLHKNEALNYNKWLNSLGYEGVNPWNDYANSAEGANGELLSGWSLRNSNLPARIKEEHSETPYMTMRAKEFIKETGDKPWCLHLSFIKPHWPYMAPAPYRIAATIISGLEGFDNESLIKNLTIVNLPKNITESFKKLNNSSIAKKYFSTEFIKFFSEFRYKEHLAENIQVTDIEKKRLIEFS